MAKALLNVVCASWGAQTHDVCFVLAVQILFVSIAPGLVGLVVQLAVGLAVTNVPAVQRDRLLLSAL